MIPAILASILIPLGGKLVGSVLRSKNQNAIAEVVEGLADTLGTKSTPEAIADALRSDPAASSKVVEFERANAERLQSILDHELAIARLQDGQMQREGQNERWWQSAWRPFFGLCYAIAFLGIGLSIAQAIWTGNRGVMEMLAVTPAALLGIDGKASFGVFILLVLITGAAVMGVYVWKRSDEKRAG